MGLTGFRGTVYTLAGKYIDELGAYIFIGIYGTLLTVPVSNYAHRSNPYLTTKQQNMLCAMEWGFAIASVAVPLLISNCWNPLGWATGAIALVGLGITAIGIVTISCPETYYMESNNRNDCAGNWS